MVLEREILPFWQWLPLGLVHFMLVIVVVAGLAAFGGFLLAAVRHGPSEAIGMTLRTIYIGIRELLETSPRRVLAMSRLAFQEAVRRKVLVVFAVFLACMLFAGWFLDRGSDHPARLYLSFVLTSTNYLIIILAIFLGTFSLPNDMKNRTIYTVVTKPVRPWEIVLGRILGFAAIGTLLLLMMGLFSYVFVVRGLRHTHTIDPREFGESTIESRGELVPVKQGQTSLAAGHRHEVTDYGQGGVRLETNQDHAHRVVRRNGQEGAETYAVGPAEGLLQARIPKYGTLRFLGREGKPVERGVNVGNEWTYRSYIEGGTLHTAIWTFEGLREPNYRDGLPLEMSIRVFRTYKGDVERGIFGSLQVVEADPSKPLSERRRFEKINFTAREFTTDSRPIPRKHTGIEPDGTIREMDLFQDLVHDGKLEIWIQCGERAQYFGVAQADLYLRAANGFFGLNFVKGYATIWFQMLIVTCFAVMFSTFLTGAVAMLATVASLVLGFFASFVIGVATGEVEGGGPSESAWRLFSQENVTIELEQSLATTIAKAFDAVIMFAMRAVASVLPNYGDFNTANFVAYGFDISPGLLAQSALITLAYFVAVTTAAYFFLKTREIAA